MEVEMFSSLYFDNIFSDKLISDTFLWVSDKISDKILDSFCSKITLLHKPVPTPITNVFQYDIICLKEKNNKFIQSSQFIYTDPGQQFVFKSDWLNPNKFF